MCVVLGKVCAERQWMKGCLRVSPVLDGNASGEAEDLSRLAGPVAGEEWKKGRLFLLFLRALLCKSLDWPHRLVDALVLTH